MSSVSTPSTTNNVLVPARAVPVPLTLIEGELPGLPELIIVYQPCPEWPELESLQAF